MSQVKNAATKQQNWIENSNLKLNSKNPKPRNQVKHSQKIKIMNRLGAPKIRDYRKYVSPELKNQKS